MHSFVLVDADDARRPRGRDDVRATPVTTRDIEHLAGHCRARRPSIACQAFKLSHRCG